MTCLQLAMLPGGPGSAGDYGGCKRCRSHCGVFTSSQPVDTGDSSPALSWGCRCVTEFHIRSNHGKSKLETPWGPLAHVSKSGENFQDIIEHLYDMLHAEQNPFLCAACAKQLHHVSSVTQHLDGLSNPCSIAHAVVTWLVP